MRTLHAYLWLLMASVSVALIPALMPDLDIAVAGYFLRSESLTRPSEWFWVVWINEYTPTVFRSLVVICIPAWAIASLVPRLRRWAMPIAFVGLAVFLGPGLLVNALKDYSLRARPFHVTEFGGARQFTPALEKTNQCTDNCAFVSGHVACGFFFASFMLIDRKRRWRWVATGVGLGMLVGFARISVGAHWLSDALWAFPVTLLASGMVWAGMWRFYGAHPASPARSIN